MFRGCCQISKNRIFSCDVDSGGRYASSIRPVGFRNICRRRRVCLGVVVKSRRTAYFPVMLTAAGDTPLPYDR